jgi:hypothetical protein
MMLTTIQTATPVPNKIMPAPIRTAKGTSVIARWFHFFVCWGNLTEFSKVFGLANTLSQTCLKALVLAPAKLVLSQLALRDGFPSGSEETLGRAPGPTSLITTL